MSDKKVSQIKDPVVRECIEDLYRELKKIKSLPVAKEDVKSLAYIINKITGKLK